MKFKNPIPKAEREKLKEARALVKLLIKKNVITKEELKNELENNL